MGEGAVDRKVRHDIRGEATAIVWAANALLDDAEGEQRQLLEETVRAAERIVRLVDEHLS